MNLVVLEHPMLHTQFQSHRPFVFGEEDFLRFLTYMGMVASLVMWPGPFEQTFVPPSQGGCIWNLASIGPVVQRRRCLKMLTYTLHTYIHTHIHTYGRRRPAYPISSPVSLRLRWAKISQVNGTNMQGEYENSNWFYDHTIRSDIWLCYLLRKKEKKNTFTASAKNIHIQRQW